MCLRPDTGWTAPHGHRSSILGCQLGPGTCPVRLDIVHRSVWTPSSRRSPLPLPLLKLDRALSRPRMATSLTRPLKGFLVAFQEIGSLWKENGWILGTGQGAQRCGPVGCLALCLVVPSCCCPQAPSAAYLDAILLPCSPLPFFLPAPPRPCLCPHRPASPSGISSCRTPADSSHQGAPSRTPLHRLVVTSPSLLDCIYPGGY